MAFLTGNTKRSESSFILPIDIESRITAQPLDLLKLTTKGSPAELFLH